MRNSYLRYSDSLEVPQTDEETLGNQIAESMARVGCAAYLHHAHATRNAHAKSHGILKGELVINDNLPPHLAQGLFSRPARYPVIIRLSSSPGEIQADQAAARGFAVKVLGVAGNSALPGETTGTLDFLLVNSPSIAFGDVQSYQCLQNALEEAAQHPDGLAGLAGCLRQTPDPNLEKMLSELACANTNHVLGETYYSMAALRFGEYVAKISVTPASESVKALTGIPVDTHVSPSAFRDAVVDFFLRHSAVYSLRAQLCRDLAAMPIEDASVVWDEAISAYEVIGRIDIPQQEAYSPARQIYGDEVLSFDPWRTLDAHRPLGSIMRIRRKVYGQSSRYRHAMNHQPREEPKDISELPD